MSFDLVSDELLEQVTDALQAGDAFGAKQAIAEAAVKVADDRGDFRKAADRFFTEFMDIAGDPALMARAREIDVAFARSNPELSYWDRLKQVGRAVRVEQSGDQEGDAHAAIVEMTKGGHRRLAALTDTDVVAEPDDHDAEVSETISRMQRERNVEFRKERLEQQQREQAGK